MIKMKDIITENDDPFAGLIKMYHGGRKWSHFDAEVVTPKRGRAEAGPGIYTTTSYETASSYARGSNVVSIVGIQKNITLADAVNISLIDILEFAKTYIGPKNRKDFISICRNSAERQNQDSIPAQHLLNITVNLEIGGKQGMHVMKFIVGHGVDASIQRNSQDEWLIIHNPKVIKKVIHTKPSDVAVEKWDLPSINKQMGI